MDQNSYLMNVVKVFQIINVLFESKMQEGVRAVFINELSVQNSKSR